MNIKLSIYTNRTKGLSGYAVCINGEYKVAKIRKLVSDNIKADIITRLSQGLRVCRNIVSHDDILYIEIQNRHLANWLDGKEDYKGYDTYLDEAYDVLESLDCKYKFMFVKSPMVKPLVDKGVKMTIEYAPEDITFGTGQAESIESGKGEVKIGIEDNNIVNA